MENKYKKWLSNVWITTLIFSHLQSLLQMLAKIHFSCTQWIDGLEALNSYGYASKKRKIF